LIGELKQHKNTTNNYMKKQLVLTLGLITLITSVTRGSQEELASSINQTRQEAAGTAAQLNSALAALNTLVGQEKGDLHPAYQAFKAEIPKTQAASMATGARVQKMSEQKGKYFADWQKTVDSINNKSLQKKAQKRLKAASESYDKVEAALSTAGEKFRPFLSDLSDVDKALSHDVTTRGVKGMKGVVRSANWNYKAVSASINDALKEMEKMEKALSSQAT